MHLTPRRNAVIWSFLRFRGSYEARYLINAAAFLARNAENMSDNRRKL